MSGMYDAHAHLIGRPPFADDWKFATPEATVADFLSTLDANGVEKAVLVQPVAHGFDNSLMLSALSAFPDRLCGIAVVRPDVTPKALRGLRDAGVRGVRLGLKAPISALGTLAPRLADAGLHVQLLMYEPDILRYQDDIRACPLPVVIDHLAHPNAANGMDGSGFRAVSSLLNLGHVYAKVSAVYRYAGLPDYSDAAPLYREIIKRHPHRLVWGSDWPYLNQTAPVPEYPKLLSFLRQNASADSLDAITRETPAKLYGF